MALFEIGADTTSLKVLRDDEMLYDRDQAFGGSQLTQLISRQYGFSFEEAEQKKLGGDLPEDYEIAILAPFVDSLSQEIGRALQYFFTSTPHHKVHYVMLAGGTATLPGLKERVTDLTGFASMVVNPFEHMKLGSSVRENKVRREAPSATDGLWAGDAEVHAVILINLLPHREEKRAGAQAPRTLHGLAACGVRGPAGGLACGSVCLSQMKSAQEERNAFLGSEIKKLEARDQGHRQPARRDRRTEGSPKGGGGSAGDRNVPVHLLNELVKQTPEGVYLN